MKRLSVILLGCFVGFILLLLTVAIIPEGNGRLIIGLISLVAPPIAGLIILYRWRVQEVEKLRLEYEKAKNSLRKKPKDSRLREAALMAGRSYYARLRDENLPTIYDEQAIANDLNTITGTDPE